MFYQILSLFFEWDLLVNKGCSTMAIYQTITILIILWIRWTPRVVNLGLPLYILPSLSSWESFALSTKSSSWGAFPKVYGWSFPSACGIMHPFCMSNVPGKAGDTLKCSAIFRKILGPLYLLCDLYRYMYIPYLMI